MLGVVALSADWRAVLAPALAAPEAQALGAFLAGEEALGKAIYPPEAERFAALAATSSPGAVKVVILGQDPYHGAGQAHGLAFSVQRGVRVPPSLANIFKEIEGDLGHPRPAHGDLSAWAGQGVLLLNAVLSVEHGKPGSHQRKGWEAITDAVIAAIAARAEPCVFMLWGNHARAKAARIAGLETGPHLVLSAPHPSPLSAYTGFLGCRHFSAANDFLRRHGRDPVDWRL